MLQGLDHEFGLAVVPSHRPAVWQLLGPKRILAKEVWLEGVGRGRGCLGNSALYKIL